MEDNFTPDEILQAFDNLPDSVKEAIVDIPIPEIVKDIGEKYGLHIDIVGSIYSKINMITIGLGDRDTLRSDILSMPNFPKGEIDNVMHDINEEIFRPLREAVISYDQMKDEVIEETTPKEELEPISNNNIAGVEYIENTSAPVKEDEVSLKEKEKFALVDSGISIEEKPIPSSISLKDLRPELSMKSPLGNTEKVDTATKPSVPNFVEEKLKGSFSINQEKTNHSLPSVGNEKKSVDQYREPI